jgi:hypothetical protein
MNVSASNFASVQQTGKKRIASPSKKVEQS